MMELIHYTYTIPNREAHGPRGALCVMDKYRRVARGVEACMRTLAARRGLSVIGFEYATTQRPQDDGDWRILITARTEPAGTSA